MHFFLQGCIQSVPSVSVILYLEELGYSIASVNMIDAVINGAWFLRHYFPPRWQMGAQLGGALFWILLLAPPFAPELFLFLAESCNAFTQTGVEKEGVSPARIRYQIYGNIVGSIAGGHILTNFGRQGVFLAEALLYLVAMVHGSRTPITTIDPPPQEQQSELKSLAFYITFLSMLPDAASPLFFYLSDELRFTPTDYGYMDALGSICTLIGTMIVIPHVFPLFSYMLSLNGFFTILLLSRWILGYDWALAALPSIPITILGSALGTQYSVSASRDIAYWSTLPLRGRFIGIVLSNALTMGLGVNHNQFRNLRDLVLIVAIGAQCQMIVAAALLRRTYALLPSQGEEGVEMGG